MKIFCRSTLAVVCLLSVSMTLGAAWTTRRLTNNAGTSGNPDIATWGENVYAVWEDDTYAANSEIFFRKSADRGTTWQTKKRLTSNAGESSKPRIAVNNSNVYVVWHDNTPGYDEIFFQKSTDGGAIWQIAKRLTNNSGLSNDPVVAVNGLNVFVVWHDWTPGDAEIFFRRSMDGGVTWQAEKRLTSNTGNSLFPSIAVSGLNVLVAWYDYTPGNADIYLQKSTDGGATWHSARRLTSNAGDSLRPDIVIAGSNVYVVWADFTPGNFEIYFRKSTNVGATWQTPKKIVTDTGSSFDPTIAVSGVNIFVAWYDRTPGNPEIYFRKSTDDGATWQTTKNLSDNAGESYSPRTAVNSSNVYVIWHDDTPGNEEIYVKYSPLL